MKAHGLPPFLCMCGADPEHLRPCPGHAGALRCRCCERVYHLMTPVRIGREVDARREGKKGGRQSGYERAISG